MKFRTDLIRWTVGFSLLFFLANVAGAAVPRESAISLASHVIDVRTDVDAAVPSALRASPSGEQYVLVKFPAPISAEERRDLAAAVERIYTYLPHDAFLVKLDPARTDAARLAALGASWTGPYHPSYKLSPSVAAAAPAAALGEELIPVRLDVYPDADLAQVRRRVADLGVARIVGEAEKSFFSRLRLLLTPAELAVLRDDLARLSEVFWIDTEPRRVLLNDTTVWVGQSGLDGGEATPVFANGIFGEGQIVGVLDTGLDPDMCYFRDPVLGLPPRNECDGGTVVDLAQRKVLAVDFLWGSECAGGVSNFEWDTHDHGTHVAGTAVGDDLANPLVHDPGDGMAPGARLVVQDGGFATDNCADLPGLGCPVVDLVPIFQQAYDQGVRIHTNSWGDRENSPQQNIYSAATQDADEFMWNNPDFLLLFAAGNSGPGGSTVSTPSTGKNVISVGATQRAGSAESMASFSSCGPTDDSRIKPDLTIPGQSIISANNDQDVATNNCGTRSMSGTSMASPAAAGLAALVRQYFDGGWYPTGAEVPADAFTPSAALVKAALLNSTRQMFNSAPIPSLCQGWGRILLDDTLFFPGDLRRLWVEDDAAGFDTGAAGDSRVFYFDVTDPTQPLRVTLTWTDFPSTPAANPHLNNDLDLTVAGPAGTFFGNVFSNGVSVTGGVADRRNTVEQVLIADPAPGEYTVTVGAWNVPDGPQPFALVVSGDVTALDLDGLLFRDGFESGDASAWSEVVTP